MGRKFGSRNRPRSIEIDVNALREKERTRRVQNVAFPSSEPETTTSVPPQAADKIASDAKEKESILEAAKKIPEIFTAEQVKWFFDVYVAVLCFVYSIALKTDFTALQEELSFSEDQKDQLAKPLAKICSKYAPSSWAGMSAEIELVMMMGVWTVASFQRAKNVARAQLEKQRDAERTQPVQPIRNSVRHEVHVPA